MTTDIDFDDAPLDENEMEELEEDEGPARRRNPLRIILLVLIILVLLCVVCFLASRFLPIPGLPALPGLPGTGPGAPTPPPAVDTPTPLPTDAAQLPPEATEEPVPVEPATQEPAPTDESQLPATEEPVPPDEGQAPATEEPPGTVEPVPGPTSTPTVGATAITIEPSCDNNNPPVANADGPYNAMIGKGQAIVTFDGSVSSDADGTIESYEWDFGDGSTPGSGKTVTHGYTRPGSYVVELTVTDNCGASSLDTTEVTIVGPTPPANGSPTPSPTNQPPEAATLGFCHLVQYGQTLSGIAAFYGVPWQILAEVNGVAMEYFVIAGQGLFIPVSEVQPGPNVYEVQPGDTLNSVAYQCGLSRTVLANANNLDVTAGLTPGQQLVIPLWCQVYP